MSYDDFDPIDAGEARFEGQKPKSAAVQAALERGRGGGKKGSGGDHTKEAIESGKYTEVKNRIQEFYAKYPTGAIETSNVEVLRVGDTGAIIGVIVKAKAWRVPDDPHPGTGTSWMMVPGKTPYTNGSELENAETSAWGRAIASVGIAIDKGIATASEIRSKGGEGAEQPSIPGSTNADALREAAAEVAGSPVVEAAQAAADAGGGPAEVMGAAMAAEEKPKTKSSKAKAAPKAEEPPPSVPTPADGPAPVSEAPGAGEAAPLAPEGSEEPAAPAGMAVTRDDEGQAGLDYDEFMRLAREKFIPTGHIGATARNLVEQGKVSPTDSVKKMSDQERLLLFMAALASFEEDTPKA